MGRDVDSRPPLGRRAPCPCLSFPRPPVSTMLLELLCVSLEGWGKAKTWNRPNRCPPCTSWRCVPRDPHPLISCPGLSEGPLGHGGHRRPWHERQDGGQGRASLGCQKGPPSALLISIHPREQLVWLGPRGGAQRSHRPPTTTHRGPCLCCWGQGPLPTNGGPRSPGGPPCVLSLSGTPPSSPGLVRSGDQTARTPSPGEAAHMPGQHADSGGGPPGLQVATAPHPDPSSGGHSPLSGAQSRAAGRGWFWDRACPVPSHDSGWLRTEGLLPSGCPSSFGWSRGLTALLRPQGSPRSRTTHLWRTRYPKGLGFGDSPGGPPRPHRQDLGRPHSQRGPAGPSCTLLSGACLAPACPMGGTRGGPESSGGRPQVCGRLWAGLWEAYLRGPGFVAGSSPRNPWSRSFSREAQEDGVSLGRWLGESPRRGQN